MANKKVTKKKVEKVEKKPDVRIKIWKIVNFVLIMATVVFFAAYYAQDGAINVWWNYTGHYTVLEKSLVEDVGKMMVENALISVGVYAVLQVYYYILYMFKLKKTMYVSLLLLIIIMVTDIAALVDYFVLAFPIVSVLIYFRLLKLEER